MPNKEEVKGDMLTLHSTVQEVLRALYFYRTDYIMVEIGKRERLLFKDQLVALLEQGSENATLEELFSVTLTEPIAAKMQMEDIPQRLPLLLFSQGQLSSTTFEEYREDKMKEAMIRLPDWWGIPLPLLHIDEDSISLNGKALEMIPGGAASLAGQTERLRIERLIVIREKRNERTLSLAPLTENTFFLEDISGDFEMAEDLVWWAAVGKALVRRMEENGLSVKRFSAYEDPPETAAETIACSWDGDLMGRLVILIPEQDGTDLPQEAQEVQSKTPKKRATVKSAAKRASDADAREGALIPEKAAAAKAAKKKD